MILVVGSTGLLGGAITRRLLATAQPVRILQRDNPAAQTWIDQGAEAAGRWYLEQARSLLDSLPDPPQWLMHEWEIQRSRLEEPEGAQPAT